MATTDNDKKRTIDWEKIETDYRVGIKTLRQIGQEHGITHVAVQKRASRCGWSRDLSAKILQKADELVTKASVTNEVTNEKKLVTEREIVESNAQAIVQVRLSHRKDIARNRALSSKLLEELEAQTNDPDLFAELAELMRAPDARGMDRLNDLYRKVIDTPSRIDSAKKLAETLKTLIGLEREAFGMDTDDTANKTPERDLSDDEIEARISALVNKQTYGR